MTLYYLPLNYENLPHYFSTALIAPASFYKNRQQDIQSNFDGILISSKYKWIKDCSCSLELLIIDDDVKENELINTKQEGFQILYKPLPISRIKKIFLTNQTDKQNISYKIHKGTAFVPDDLFSIEQTTELKELNNDLLTPNNNNDNTFYQYYFDKLTYYDNLLGGISLLQSLSVYKETEREKEKKVLEFCYATSHINLLIHNQFEELQEKYISPNKYNYSKFYDELLNNKEKLQKIRSAIKNKQSSLKELKDFAQEKNVTLEIQGALKEKVNNLDKLAKDDIELYLYYFIANYGDDTKNFKTETLLNELFNNQFEHIEKIGFVFGLYQGYKKFYNDYKFNDIDEKLKVKFQLNSKLDYYLIESAYQRTLNEKEISEINQFLELDNLLKSRSLEESIQNDDYEHYTILDTVVYSKKRKPFFSTSFFSGEFLGKYAREIFSMYIEKSIEELEKLCDDQNNTLNKNDLKSVIKGIKNGYFDSLEQIQVDYQHYQSENRITNYEETNHSQESERKVSVEEIINQIANQEKIKEIGNKTQREQAKMITDELIANKIKDENYTLPKNQLSKWKNEKGNPNENSKHYYAYLLWKSTIAPYLNSE